MAKVPRIPKTLQKKLQDLEDHLFLLQEALAGLVRGETAFFKSLSTELRVLVCFSSGTEGLLWRLAQELHIPDSVYVHLAGNLKRDHPLAKSLKFLFIPVLRAGLGDPRLPPALYSLRAIIKECEAFYISGRGITHESLIKSVAQQMGSAHEDEGVESYLVELSDVLFSDQQPFVQVLTSDALLVLEVGDRVLKHAQSSLAYPRRHSFKPLLATKVPPVQDSSDFDHPSLVELPRQGTVFFLVDHPHNDWVVNRDKYSFASLQQGRLKVTPTKHEDGTMQIVIEGLSEKPLISRQAIPHSAQPGVSITVTWTEGEVNIYANGKRVETIPNRIRG